MCHRCNGICVCRVDTKGNHVNKNYHHKIFMQPNTKRNSYVMHLKKKKKRRSFASFFFFFVMFVSNLFFIVRWKRRCETGYKEREYGKIKGKKKKCAGNNFRFGIIWYWETKDGFPFHDTAKVFFFFLWDFYSFIAIISFVSF